MNLLASALLPRVAIDQRHLGVTAHDGSEEYDVHCIVQYKACRGFCSTRPRPFVHFEVNDLSWNRCSVIEIEISARLNTNSYCDS